MQCPSCSQPVPVPPQDMAMCLLKDIRLCQQEEQLLDDHSTPWTPVNNIWCMRLYSYLCSCRTMNIVCVYITSDKHWIQFIIYIYWCLKEHCGLNVCQRLSVAVEDNEGQIFLFACSHQQWKRNPRRYVAVCTNYILILIYTIWTPSTVCISPPAMCKISEKKIIKFNLDGLPQWIPTVGPTLNPRGHARWS